ncbi:MAG: hypothetical protein HZB38_11735 [Planctomycetes bacterium]|nr:hypothetical protein [Planctomycetota bacterium]
MRRLLSIAAIALLPSAFAQDPQPSSRPYNELTAILVESRPATAVEKLAARLEREPGDDANRLALGVSRLFAGVERLCQSLYAHGADPSGLVVLDFATRGGMTHLPIPKNPNPAPITYEGCRQILGRFLSELESVESTLAPIRDESVKLPLPIGLIRFDINNDGSSDQWETAWELYARLARARNFTEEKVRTFVIVLDRADVEWLRGYCRLLHALGDIALAYDMREMFERTGHLVFEGMQSPYPFLRATSKPRDIWGTEILDLIAMIHLTNFRLVEPQRMAAARTHLLAMIDHSRTMWRYVLAENDDDGEWIPSPKQTGVIPNARIDQETVDGWHFALGEFEALLNGRKLVPFWRDDPRGVNLRAFFEQPADFDLVLWVQGTAAAPYLESGVKIDRQSWRRIESLFGGRFLTFAVWVN